MRPTAIIIATFLLSFPFVYLRAQNLPLGKIPAGGSGTVDAARMNLAGNPSIPICPIAACPLADANGGPVRAAFATYGRTTLKNSWEFQLYAGLYSNTGRGSSTAGIAAPGAKTVGYFGLMQDTNSGPGWGLNWNVLRNARPGGDRLYGQPGSGSPGVPGAMDDHMSTIGAEGDLSNWQNDTNDNNAFVVNLYLATNSSYTSLAGIYMGATTAQKAASYHTGIYFSGKQNGGSANTADDQAIWDRSGANFGYLTDGEHAQAAFSDQSTGQNGLLVSGKKTGQDIWLNTNSKIGMYISGQHAAGDIVINTTSRNAMSISGEHREGHVYGDTSSAATGVNLEGRYSHAAINIAPNGGSPTAIAIPTNMTVCFEGTSRCLSYNGKKLVYNVDRVSVFSIDDNGNMIIKGSLKQSSIP
ncbi:hypothetical protein [Komagataeibacter europaeus]|uniref:hypothetical protein n=1 Tax=Komagataeibacter europaeus TaxID=33995 RepID=UPI0002F60274|nr:hypothetical protein [Komagataeibacter europaeus]